MCSSVTRVVACRETAIYMFLQRKFLDMQCCVVSTCFAKEILGHATLVQLLHLVCGFPCFIGDFRTHNAFDAFDTCTSTTD